MVNNEERLTEWQGGVRVVPSVDVLARQKGLSVENVRAVIVG